MTNEPVITFRPTIIMTAAIIVSTFAYVFCECWLGQTQYFALQHSEISHNIDNSIYDVTIKVRW